MTRTKTYKQGNQQYVTIPPEFELPDGEVEISAYGRGIKITPIVSDEEKAERDEELARAYQEAGQEPQIDEGWE